MSASPDFPNCQQPAKDSLTVYFDGSCPLCQAEISYFQDRHEGDTIRWIDVSDSGEQELGPDLSQRDAMRRFHVRTADGQLHSGSRAFALMWRQIPGFRWLGKLASVGGVSVVLEWMYRGFLHIRPALQRVYRKIRNPSPQST